MRQLDNKLHFTGHFWLVWGLFVSKGFLWYGGGLCPVQNLEEMQAENTFNIDQTISNPYIWLPRPWKFYSIASI